MAISNFVVARSETGVGEHAVSDRTAQMHPVKTATGKKPVEKMSKPLIPMGARRLDHPGSQSDLGNNWQHTRQLEHGRG
jgi:hypothetical protein